MNSNQIKTPLLRYCLFYFGSFSVQLLPVYLKSSKSLLHFLCNCFLFYILMHKMYDWVCANEAEYDPQNAFHQMRRSKPLYSFLISISDRFIYPFTSLLLFVYFFYLSNSKNSRKRPKETKSFIEILDSLIPQSVYKNANAKQQFIILFLFFNTLFISLNLKAVYSNIQQFTFKSVIYNAVSINLLIFTRYMPALFVHYVQFFTLYLLKIAVKKYSFSKQTGKKYHFLRAEVIRLAKLNDQFCGLFSLPLLVFLASYIIDLVSGLVYQVMVKFSYFQPFYLHPAIHLMAIVFYETKIDQQLKAIESMLKNELQNELDNWNAIDKVHETISKFTLVSMYRKSFKVKLFNLTDSFSWSFALSLALFVLQYSVIILQTSQ